MQAVPQQQVDVRRHQRHVQGPIDEGRRGTQHHQDLHRRGRVWIARARTLGQLSKLAHAQARQQPQHRRACLGLPVRDVDRKAELPQPREPGHQRRTAIAGEDVTLDPLGDDVPVIGRRNTMAQQRIEAPLGRLSTSRERQRLTQPELELQSKLVPRRARRRKLAIELEQPHTSLEVADRGRRCAAVEHLVAGHRVELGELDSHRGHEIGQREPGPLGRSLGRLVDQREQAMASIDVIDQLEHRVRERRRPLNRARR